MGLEVAPGLEPMLRGNRIGALVGEDLASDLDVRVGDAVVVQSRGVPRRDGTSQWDFEVVGIYPPSGILSADRFFANYNYIDASVTEPGMVSTLFLTVRPGVAVGEVAAAIDDESLNSAFPLNTLPMESWLSLDGRPIGDTLTMISIVGALIAGIAVLVQGSATAQDISAKGPLLAVLRVYGHSWPAIWCCVAAAVGLFSLGAAAVGCMLASALFPLLGPALAAQFNIPSPLLPSIVAGMVLFSVVVTAVPIALGIKAPLARQLAGLGH